MFPEKLIFNLKKNKLSGNNSQDLSGNDILRNIINAQKHPFEK